MRRSWLRSPWFWVVALYGGFGGLTITAGYVAPGVFFLGVPIAWIAALGVWQVWSRVRTRRRRAIARPNGRGYWKGWMQFDPGLWMTANRWARARYRALRVEIVTDDRGLTIKPGPGPRRLGGLRPLTLAWQEVVGARVVGSRRELPGGRLSVTRQTHIVIDVVGDRVPTYLRMMTDSEAAEWGMTPEERAEADRMTVELVAEMMSDAVRFGMLPLSICSDDPDGLVNTVALWARGQAPVHPDQLRRSG